MPTGKLKPGPRTGPRTPEEQTLYDAIRALIFKNRMEGAAGGDMPPLPPSPPGFRQSTVAPVNMNNPKWPDHWQEMRRIVPEVEGVVPRIQYGPIPEVHPLMLEDLGNFSSMDGTTLNGAYGMRTKQIGIQPSLSTEPTGFGTMTHELGHGLGLAHGEELDELQRKGEEAAPRPETLVQVIKKRLQGKMKVR